MLTRVYTFGKQCFYRRETLNQMILMGFAIVLGLLIITLVILVINLNKTKTARRVSQRYHDERQLLNIHIFELPPGVEKIPRQEMFGALRSIFKVFKSLDYKKSNIADFSKQQWHSWQVGILFRFYKMEHEFPIDHPEDIFPEDILTLKDKDLRFLLNDIMVRYKRDVELDRTRDSLSRDIRWSGRDIAIIFYFLSRYKEYAL